MKRGRDHFSATLAWLLATGVALACTGVITAGICAQHLLRTFGL